MHCLVTASVACVQHCERLAILCLGSLAHKHGCCHLLPSHAYRVYKAVQRKLCKAESGPESA